MEAEVFRTLDEMAAAMPGFTERVAPGLPLRFVVVQLLCTEHQLDPVSATDALNAWVRTRQASEDLETEPPALAIAGSPNGHLEALRNLFADAEAERDLTRAALALIDLGAGLTDHGRHDEALACYMAARERMQATGDLGGLALADMEIAITTSTLGWRETALTSILRAKAYFDDHGSMEERARVAQNFGMALVQAGRPREGSVQYEVAARLWKAARSPSGVADIVHNLADVHLHLGRLSLAETGFLESRSLYAALGQTQEVADADTALGDVYAELGRFEEGAERAQAGLDTYLQLGLPLEAANARRVLAHALDHLGDHDGARTAMLAARATYQEAGQELDKANCDTALAYTCGYLEDYDAAISHIEAARTVYLDEGWDWDAAWHDRFVSNLRRGRIPTHTHPDDDALAQRDGPLGIRFSDALRLAAELHGTQVRKSAPGEPDGPPYVAHLLGVAALVIEDGGTEDEAIAALLHDAVEDTATSVVDIELLFGKNVADIVASCSDATSVPKPPWRERKETYLARLASKPPAVLRVSCADKLYNARTILRDYRAVGEKVWDRFTGKKEGTLWYYSALAEILAEKHPGYLADELLRVVEELKK